MIRATCTLCGDIDLEPPQVRLVVLEHSEASYYGFSCPRCGEETRREASQRTVTLLVYGGVPVQRVRVPAEAGEQHDGPVLTEDDVLEFAAALSRADLLAPIAAALLTSPVTGRRRPWRRRS